MWQLAQPQLLRRRLAAGMSAVKAVASGQCNCRSQHPTSNLGSPHPEGLNNLKNMMVDQRWAFRGTVRGQCAAA